MLSTLAAGAITGGLNAHATGLAQAAARAGLVDLDGTVFIQAILFVVLMIVLPRLIFKPMLARIDQREARTDGARGDARTMRHAADEQAAAYDKATAEEKRRALEERARVRVETEQRAAQMVQQARQETTARIDAGIAAQHKQVADSRARLQIEAGVLARQIADQIAEG